MTTKIIEIHSVTALNDWYFDNFTGSTLSEYEPAICLALITTMETDYDSIEKKVVPLKADDLLKLKVGEIFEESSDDLISLVALKVRLE